MVLFIAVILLLGGGAFAADWRLGGYVRYSISWGNLNDFIKGYNSWIQALGLTDFEMEELDEQLTIYCLGSRQGVSPRWEVETVTVLFSPGTISESKEKTIPLQGGGEKSLEAEGQINYSMTMMDWPALYCFSPSSKLTSFVGLGATLYGGSVSGSYYACERVYTLPSNYEYRYLNQSFGSSFNARLGYVLQAGIDYSLGKNFKVGLEVKHRQVSPMKYQAAIYNSGFSSSPSVPPELEIDPKGTSCALYLMLYF